jgi:flagellar hook assembly protein FlgD
MVFPNPVRASRSEQELTVGQLPKNATVRIYSPAGRLVKVLSIADRRERKVTWDLRTRRGEKVPSGIYLVRVEAPDASPVTKKAAVVR